MEEKENSHTQVIDRFDDPDWGAEKLQAIGIFKNFNLTELAKVYKIGVVLPLKPQAHAVIEGEATRGLYIILSGKVSVYKNDVVTGAMHRIAYMEEGHSFGELSLFDDAPRSATVVADSHCYLFHLEAGSFEKFLKMEGFEFTARFFKTCAEDMAERFRAINSDYISSQQLLWKYALRRVNDGSEDKT
jgi:CRP-like cAMP-binding protein